MFQKALAYLLKGKQYKEMKEDTGSMFLSFCLIVSDVLQDIKINVNEDGNIEYLIEIQKDGFIETEGFIYTLWFYKNNGKWGKDFGELWLSEICNTYEKKLKGEGVTKKTLEMLLRHVKMRCIEYDNGDDSTALLQKNILQKHTVSGIDLLAREDITNEAKTIQGYIKLFSQNLDKNLRKSIG